MTLPPQAAGCSPSSAGQQEGTSEGIRQESKNQVGFEKLGFLRGSYVVIWRPLVASLALHRPLLTVCTAHKEYTVHCESKAALLRQLPSPQAITVRVCFPSDTRHASFQLILAEGLLCAKHTWHFCPLHLFSTQKPEVRSCSFSTPNSPLPHSTWSKGQSLYNSHDLFSSLELSDLPITPSFSPFQLHWPHYLFLL